MEHIKMPIDIKFHSYHNMQNGTDKSGKYLLNVLANCNPEYFGNEREGMMLDSIKSNILKRASGLIVRYIEKEVACVLVVYNNVIHRVFTPIKYRRQGMMRTTLNVITKLMIVSKCPFESPVERDLIPFFHSLGWKTDITDVPNVDGTIQMYLKEKQPPNTKIGIGSWVYILDNLC